MVRHTLLVALVAGLPASALGQLQYLSAVQQFNGNTLAVAQGGSPSVPNSFNLVNNSPVSWSPPRQTIESLYPTTGARRARAYIDATYTSTVTSSQLSFRNVTFDALANGAALATPPSGAEMTYNNTFTFRFQVAAPTEVGVSASITREHPSGWASGQPCSITFGPEGGAAIFTVQYLGGVPPFPYVHAYPTTAVTLQPGVVYRVEARNFNTGGGFTTGVHHRDDIWFELNAVPPDICDGDANGDNEVNSADLSVLLSRFGTAVTGGAINGDFNLDGVVNAADLSVLLANFGSTC